jgi:hypothetical protein
VLFLLLGLLTSSLLQLLLFVVMVTVGVLYTVGTARW